MLDAPEQTVIGRGATGEDLSLKKSVRKYQRLSVERNLAKFFSFIFTPSHGLHRDRVREKTWMIDKQDSTIVAKIIVEPVNGETLTTFDHKNLPSTSKSLVGPEA